MSHGPPPPNNGDFYGYDLDLSDMTGGQVTTTQPFPYPDDHGTD